MNGFQVAQKPATMQQLADLIRAKVVQKTQSKGKSLRGKRDVATETESKEQQIANRISRAIEEELKWSPSAFVMLTHHQHCKCGNTYQNVMGVFLESRHVDSRARRLGRPKDLTQLDYLPHRWEESNEQIPICPNCLLERELAQAVMQPIHDSCVQLPLFGHILQTRSCT